MTKIKLAPTGILDPCGKYPNPFTKQPWSDYYYKYTDNCKKDPFWFSFPTWEDRAEIFHKIHQNQIILVTAGTGVGKTFIVPKLFSHYFNYEKPIIMTVPKKTLVEEGANQVSLFLGVPYKKKIWKIENGKGFVVDDPENIETGYKYIGIKHSGEKLFDETTKILFSTDGSLAATVCKTDPMLKEYYGLMIDEAHERNISIDILLSMCAKICRIRPEFKVMIMSATISREMVADYFTRQGLGKRYTLYNTESIQDYDKITVFKTKKKIKITDLTEDMMMKIDSFLKNENKMLDKVFSDDNYAIVKGEKREQYTKYGRDILGFVATESKINTIIKYLEKQRDLGLYPYRPAFLKLTSKSNQETKDMAYGEDGLNKYNKIYNENCKLKVMLATNVAESSVTFKDKLGFVFDTGTSWQVGFDPVKYGTYSREGFTAKANIAQRKGRTGRNCYGFYYPSYTEKQWNTEILDYESAPITKEDLTNTCLNISLMPDVKNMMGCVNFFNNMLEPIGRVRENLKVAFRNLHDYDMMYKGEITAIGKLCSKFGEFDYHIVRMVLCAYHLGGVLIPVLKLAAILQNVRSFDDLFNLPVGKSLKEMPKSIQDNIESLKSSYLHPSGEHLSMLLLFDNWLRLPEYQRIYLERYYKLNIKMFVNIEDNYKALAEIIFNNLEEIQRLKLFQEYNNGIKVPSNLKRGGGSIVETLSGNNGYDYSSSASPESMKQYLMDYKEGNYGFSFNAFNETSRTNVERWGFKPGCLGNHMSRILGLENIHYNRDGNSSSCGLMNGGGRPKMNKKLPIKKLNNLKEKNNKDKIIDKKTEKKLNNKTTDKLNNKTTEKLNMKRIEQMNKLLSSDEISLRGMFAQCPERVIDIGDISSLSIDEKVLICIYFGYCNQIGMKIDTPDSKKYVIKYSDEIANVKDTMMYKLLGILPRFSIYHTFTLSKDYDSSLAIASHLPEKIIELFMKPKIKLLDLGLI